MAQLSPLTFRISKLWGASQGTTEKHNFDKKIPGSVHDALEFSGNFQADFMFIRLKDEISVIMTDASVMVVFSCPLCLTKFEQKISIPGAEREFLYEKPERVEDEADLYMIQKKTMTIDLTEMVRQEILLHFPLISVCSKSCKGLCQTCGKNKNVEECNCAPAQNDDLTYKPFKNLKNLMQ